MALQTASPPTAPSAQVVGNAFVEQYYHILHHSPELVFRFYQDPSVIGRPDSNGVMTSATTMQGIDEKIRSMNYKEYKAEIKTADAQKSYENGVIVLVTGCLTGKDNLKRKFAQSFFLAPQDSGYFVLNDVFRYIDDGDLLVNTPVNKVDDAKVPLNTDPESTHVPAPPAPVPEIVHVEAADQNVIEKALDASHHDRQLIIEEESVLEPPSHSHESDIPLEIESASTTAIDDAPKKSYASIVKVPKGSPEPTRIYVPVNALPSMKTVNQSLGSAVPDPVPETSAPSGTSPPESSNGNEEVEGYSIYIRNLPLSVTDVELEMEFKKFGPIKQGGVQVRNNKQQGYCFGFVEFQSLSSMNSAIQLSAADLDCQVIYLGNFCIKASPINVGGRQAVVEIKRTTTRVGGNGRGSRFPPGRGGFRSDSFRSRGNYGGGRSFGRNESTSSRGEHSGRGRGSGGRGGDGYYHGRGRSSPL
ncbi:hypothetical protein F8388_010131 [Cannabis sativa]|uniref:Uncharacterized protein n=1 Tax=Cannabis sativa TaxID=3483 RepID=A0A7J6GRL6_CANSA|nr:hypothetical protein F8388_010131 [Cannabis sativa]